MTARLLLALLLVAGCATPRPGPETSPLASSFGPQGRTGAPTMIAGTGVLPTGEPVTALSSERRRANAVIRSNEPVERRMLQAGPALRGVIAHMGTAPVGPRYAAIPWGPGIRVRICAARCVTVVSADTGPSLEFQRRGRIADLSVGLFEFVCGVPASRGLCVGTVEAK